jgi:metal-dependent amidase/aminoacylase/carboxypeptidase family protein
MALATMVGMQVGERAFGVAASEGKLWVTLRAEKAEAFEALNAAADRAVREAAEAAGLGWSLQRFDLFPATVNDPALLASLEAACVRAEIPCKYLEVPFRWSEDFGCYGRFAPACFFGLGAGAETAPLHTEGYAWPEVLAPLAAELYEKLLREL